MTSRAFARLHHARIETDLDDGRETVLVDRWRYVWRDRGATYSGWYLESAWPLRPKLTRAQVFRQYPQATNPAIVR